MEKSPEPEEIESRPGSLANSARRFFTEDDMIFGRMFKRQGKARELWSDGNQALLSIDTRNVRTVTLRLAGAKLYVSCDCVYGRTRGRCGHAWSAVLQASEKGLLTWTGGFPLMAVEKEDQPSSFALKSRAGARNDAPLQARPATATAGASAVEKQGSGPEGEQGVHAINDEMLDSIFGPPSPGNAGKREKALRMWENLMRGGRGVSSFSAAHKPKALPEWKQALNRFVSIDRESLPAAPALPGTIRAGFTLNARKSEADDAIVLEITLAKRLKSGKWGKTRPLAMPRDARLLPNLGVEDRRIVDLALSARDDDLDAFKFGYYHRGVYKVQPWAAEELITLLCRSRTLFSHMSGIPDQPEGPLELDDGPPWEYSVRISCDDDKYVVDGFLTRASDEMDVRAPRVILRDGWFFTRNRVARAVMPGRYEFLSMFRKGGPVELPREAGLEFARTVLSLHNPPRLVLPAELAVSAEKCPPRPKLHVYGPQASTDDKHLRASLSFLYGRSETPSNPPGASFFDPGRKALVERDRAAEDRAMEKLSDLGARPSESFAPGDMEIPAKSLPEIVRTLAVDGWLVEAEGRKVRNPGGASFGVKSGVDWFDLEGGIDYGDVSAPLPALLEALEKGESTVVLADGSVGVIPEEWLLSWSLLAGLGRREGDALRFTKSQAGLLEILVEGRPEVTVDEVFARAREEIGRFERVEPAEPSAGFAGTLRDYQKEGLGWFRFLERFGFGGCLADDMGLGKTVQALALLHARRAEDLKTGAERRPSLVVAPKSLMFNWREETARFAPELKILEHTGPGRATDAAGLKGHDIVLTTYGTLRRDAAWLSAMRFDWVILDEAQAIKNADTASARAARLLQADHRLALSGTPVENRLAELWSLFEFLNPGMLGSAPAFDGLAAAQDCAQKGAREALRRALRPFILRRTKSQVASELPQRTEQTIHCELEGEQLDLYKELLDHYRRALLGKVETEGLGKSKILVIEALLRLRQAACHPGLIDPRRAAEPSAKIEALIERLAELHEEGHKALVFSQFTSLLSIVRRRLDDAEIPYEYLDGKTRDRAGRVARFQTDPMCGLFLISLKAGGLGLNLTAAEYVFLLDPWWNPAVEAQAIDRTHRIGQTKKVFAYRLIARDTVEEKIVELQRSKRELADAIVGGDQGLISGLTRDDLEMLLS